MKPITELEIQMHATKMFPDNPELRKSFIEGAWNTVYHTKIKTENE